MFSAFGITSLCSTRFHASTKAAGIGWRADVVLFACIFGVGFLFRILAHEVDSSFELLSAFVPLAALLVWALWKADSRRRKTRE
jgi:membrane protein DedA with SNARE-associated domain